MKTNLTDSLFTWYAAHARSLPWRDHPDPYAVWVSEIMLQQTRVETAIPYFERWMERFPDIPTLAAASLQEVLQVWEGLGYYSRARNLHRAAQIVTTEHNGKLPADIKTLRRLPGIGRYTAAAIASIAFGMDAAALDGNIRRVMARVFDVSEPARSTSGEKRLWELAEANLPAGQAGDYNQALMDLGALVCTPKSPACERCPLESNCLARQLGIQEERPVTAPRPELPHHTVAAAIIQRNGTILIAQRPPNGLLGGLWEFPGGKLQEGETLAQALQREICEELQAEVAVNEPFGIYQHAFTHFRITLHAFRCRLVGGEPRPLEASDIRWVRPDELHDYPMGKVDRQIASRLASRTTEA